MVESLGKKVIALHRSKIGDLTVKDIQLGKWKYLTDKDIRKLFVLKK